MARDFRESGDEILMLAIGLLGYKGAGKDSVANVLRDDFGFTIVKWAGPLKSMLRALMREAGCDDVTIDSMIEGDLKEVPLEELCGRTFRHAMQTLGTEWRTMIHEDLWVRIVLKQLAACEARRVVFSDCRFQHETRIIRRELGAHLWRVYRPGTFSTGHVSEKELDTIGHDRSLVNNGTILDLRDAVHAVIADEFGTKLAGQRDEVGMLVVQSASLRNS